MIRIDTKKMLSAVKSKKITELTAACVAEITGDIEYDGVTYQGDKDALDSLTYRLYIGIDPPYWVAKDNSQTSPFTIADVEALRLMIVSRAATAFEKLQAKKKAVRDATNAINVQAIVW